MTTERATAPALVLRPWRVEDATPLRAAIDESLDSIKRWMGWGHEEPSTPGVLEERLRRYADNFAAGRSWRYAVLLGDAELLAGGAGLRPCEGPSALEVSYWVRSGCRRRGVASAAAAALARHAFVSHGVERVEICVDVGNEASAAVARSLGCDFVGPLTREYADGRPRLLHAYRLDSLSALRAPACWRVEVNSSL